MQDHLRELIDLIVMIISLLFSFLYARSLTLELFDKDSTAKEKGRISVKFQDKDTNFSQRSEQPCQVHQN